MTDEAVRNAERFLGMVVRAFDFLPVVDVTFGDVVRGIVTADRALYPDDELLCVPRWSKPCAAEGSTRPVSPP